MEMLFLAEQILTQDSSHLPAKITRRLLFFFYFVKGRTSAVKKVPSIDRLFP